MKRTDQQTIDEEGFEEEDEEDLANKWDEPRMGELFVIDAIKSVTTQSTAQNTRIRETRERGVRLERRRSSTIYKLSRITQSTRTDVNVSST